MCKTVFKIFILLLTHDEELIPTSESQCLKTYLVAIRVQNFK